MKMKIIAAFAATVALGFGGCSQAVDYLQTNVINPTAKMINDPNTQLVFKTGERGVQYAACVVSAGSALAGKLEQDAGAGMSTVGTNGKIYAVSSDVCSGLGAVFQGMTTVPAGTPVVAGVQ